MKHTLKTLTEALNRCYETGSLQTAWEWKEGFEKKLRNPRVSNRIKQWLANNEKLPLILKVEMVIGLYAKEVLGDTTE